MAGIIGTNVVTQIGFIVKDADASRKKFAQFFGIEPPPIVGSGDFDVTQTQYEGKPAPDAACKMVFFDIGPNIQLELIEPNEAPSTWRKFLNEKGEGIHHIAFNVEGMDKWIIECEKFGMKCEQRGVYGDGGGEYAYLEAYDDMKCIIELLENYKK